MAEEKKDEAQPGEPTGAPTESPQAPAEAAPSATIALPAADVIQRFGGIRPMASKMNISFSTVQGWKERNHLPPARHAEILALAAKHGVSLEPGATPAPAPEAPPPAAEPIAPETGKAETTKAEPPKSEAGGFDDRPPPLPPPLPPQTVPVPPSGISLGGAIAVSVVVVAVALAGAYATRGSWSGATTTVPDNTAELTQRIAKLERDAANRPAPSAPAPDPKLLQDIAALTKKTAELDGTLAGLRTANAAAAEQARALAPRLEALEKGFDLQAFIAVRTGLSELGTKLDGLSKRIDAAERATAAARAQGLADAALALSVAQLRHAIDTGSSFAAELAACRAAAGTDAKAIAALDALAPLASAGVATRATLADDYPGAARDIAQASLKRSQTGWLRSVVDRLDALVTIRPVGPDVAGDDPRARAARAETLLDRGDLAGAVRLLGGLTERPAAAAKPWLDRAKARLAAEGSVAALESHAMAGLAQRAAQVQAPAAKP